MGMLVPRAVVMSPSGQAGPALLIGPGGIPTQQLQFPATNVGGGGNARQLQGQRQGGSGVVMAVPLPASAATAASNTTGGGNAKA